MDSGVKRVIGGFLASCSLDRQVCTTDHARSCSSIAICCDYLDIARKASAELLEAGEPLKNYHCIDMNVYIALIFIAHSIPKPTLEDDAS